MKLYCRNLCILPVIIILLSLSLAIGAASEKVSDKKIEAANSSWIFTGMATNEAEDRYYYYFHLQQQKDVSTAKVILVDAQSKKQLRYYIQEADTAENDNSEWQVGRAFLRFNVINNSWIFGLKSKNNEGFNFRVELLKQSEDADNEKELAAGLRMKILNAKRMNGHLRWGADKKEEFVTAELNWYQNITQMENELQGKPLQNVFCFLDNGNHFYSVTLPLNKARSASQIQWRDAEGKTVTASQFLQQKIMNNDRIRLTLKVPKTQLFVEDMVDHEVGSLQAGFATIAGKSAGFCFMDQLDVNAPPVHQLKERELLDGLS